MNYSKLLSPLFVLALLFVTSCSNDDDDTTDVPEPVNEEEVITTLTVVLTPAAGGDAITLVTRDLDGDGPNAPVVDVSGPLAADTMYNGVITLLNETEDPAEDITEEVEEESDEHQFFYTISGVNATTEYGNTDNNGDPLGTQLTLATGEASTGTITFTLRHEPKKPNDGTLADAGGETDIAAPFDIVIE